MRVLITATILLFVTLMAVLLTEWSTQTTLVYVGMCVMGVGVITAMWIRAWTNPVLRVLAAMLAVLMLVNAVDSVRAQRAGGSSPEGVRRPLTGVFIVGVPALLFAVTGRPRVKVFFGPIGPPPHEGNEAAS